MFALVDCNNFYASCERVFQPQLRHKPIAILSNNDGCVISRSDEAKALGLPMGAPAFKYEAFLKKNNIQVFSSNYPLYGDMSSRVMSILKRYTPDIEIYSIDEAFLQFKGFNNYNFNDYGLKIRQHIIKWTGIPTSIGIAPTKALSKVANKIARKFPKETNNVYVINTEESRVKALKWLKIEDVWGIGKRLQKRLKNNGCTTAFDFTQLSSEWIRKNFSITEWRLQQDLLGIPTLKLGSSTNKKSIATTRSFEQTYTNLSDIKERISTFASNCAEKLRRQGSGCHAIIVMLSNDKHKTNTQRYKASTMVYLPYPTDSSLIISKEAVKAVTEIFKPGIAYKKAGVVVTGLIPMNNFQLNLFDCQSSKHKPLMQVIDMMNQKYETQKIKLANQDLNRTWKMRQERLSPRYTTNINEIITVKCH